MEGSPQKRTGHQQRAILAALGSGPTTADRLRSLVADGGRADNFSRALRTLQQRGDVVANDAGLLILGSRPCVAASKDGDDYLPGRGPWKARYRALCYLFDALASGTAVRISSVPGIVSHADVLLASRAAQRLEEQGVVRRHFADGSVFQLVKHGGAALKRIWSHERAFCQIAGWDITHAHAEHMAALLRGDSLRQEAAAASFLYDVLGQNNVSRRSGLGAEALARLRLIAGLPVAVQEAMERRGLPPTFVRNLPMGASEQDLLALIEDPTGGYEEASKSSRDDPLCSPQQSSDPAALQQNELLATCVKLCAVTAELVSAMERKLDWLAKELGYEEPP